MRVATQQRSRDTQKRFIEATLKLANSGPMHLVSSKNISAEAGTAWGSAQHLFGSKEELIAAAIKYASDEMLRLCEKEFTRSNYKKSDLDDVVQFLWKSANKSNAVLCHKLAISCLHDPKITQQNRDVINTNLEKVMALIEPRISQFYPDADLLYLGSLLSITETFLTGLHFRANFTRQPAQKSKLEALGKLWAAELRQS